MIENFDIEFIENKFKSIIKQINVFSNNYQDFIIKDLYHEFSRYLNNKIIYGELLDYDLNIKIENFDVIFSLKYKENIFSEIKNVKFVQKIPTDFECSRKLLIMIEDTLIMQQNKNSVGKVEGILKYLENE